MQLRGKKKNMRGGWRIYRVTKVISGQILTYITAVCSVLSRQLFLVFGSSLEFVLEIQEDVPSPNKCFDFTLKDLNSYIINL